MTSSYTHKPQKVVSNQLYDSIDTVILMLQSLTTSKSGYFSVFQISVKCNHFKNYCPRPIFMTAFFVRKVLLWRIIHARFNFMHLTDSYQDVNSSKLKLAYFQMNHI